MKIIEKENEKIEANFEPEQQFILRLPKPQAERLKDILKAKTPQLKNRLKIDIDPQERIGKVTFDEWDMEANLVDLPTLINSFKTLDKVVLYKTADISQMLICKEVESEQSESINPQNNPSYFQWKHGITAPLKNVRKRRFRKTLKKANTEAQSISRELKYILQSDMIATKVEYRLIDPEPAPKPPPTTEEDLFGEALSSSEDDDQVLEETEEIQMEEESNGPIILRGSKAKVDEESKSIDAESLGVESLVPDVDTQSSFLQIDMANMEFDNSNMQPAFYDMAPENFTIAPDHSDSKPENSEPYILEHTTVFDVQQPYILGSDPDMELGED